MSQKMDDVIDVLCKIRDGYRYGNPEPLRKVRIRAVHAIAAGRGVDYKTIADAYIRRLAPYVRGTTDFDCIVQEWLTGRPLSLKAALDKCTMDKGDEGRLDAFFKTDGGPRKASVQA